MSTATVAFWFVVRSMGMLLTMIAAYTMKTTNRKMDTKVWIAHVTFVVQLCIW